MSNYKEQIKSPKWQKRRLEIMQADNFTCQICGDTESTLNVHHLCYHKDKNIWEYEDWELITLCENCHKEEHNSYEDIYAYVESLKSHGVTMREILTLLDSMDIRLYLGDDGYIQDQAGDQSALESNDNWEDMKMLAERRAKLKKSFYEKRDKEQREQSKDKPF